MIDIISNWAGELVVSLIIVTIIEMLLPDNKIKKYVKSVIGIYIIFCIISPFINQDKIENILENAQKNLEQIQIQSQVTSAQTEESSIEALYIQEFEKDVIKRVQELGYQVKKCEVSIEIDASKENAGIHAIYLDITKKDQEQVLDQDSNIEIEEVEKIEISINDKDGGNNNSVETENEDTKEIKKNLSEYYEISEDCIKITQN